MYVEKISKRIFKYVSEIQESSGIAFMSFWGYSHSELVSESPIVFEQYIF
jgi:hypothetical protein